MVQIELMAAASVPTVTVDDRQVAALGQVVADWHRSFAPEHVAWDDSLFWNVDESAEVRCQYLAVGNAMNFRFWDHVHGQVIPASGVVAGESYRGSLYMWRRLRCAVDRGELLLDADSLAGLTREQFKRAFRDDHGAFPLAPAAGDRLANLQDLGLRLGKSWDGEFRNVVNATAGSLAEFVRLSAGFRAFDDPVRKLTMVNAIMLCGSGLASFDADPLPAIDYHLVKQAARQGLISVHGPLARKLVDGAMIDRAESLTLRSATLDALVAVADRARISTAVLDNLYWMNRRVCSEDAPACRTGEATCPFAAVCAKRVEYGLPLELTRYY